MLKLGSLRDALKARSLLAGRGVMEAFEKAPDVGSKIEMVQKARAARSASRVPVVDLSRANMRSPWARAPNEGQAAGYFHQFFRERPGSPTGPVRVSRFYSGGNLVNTPSQTFANRTKAMEHLKAVDRGVVG